MADWHVSGSESDGEGAGDGGVMVGDLRIPPQRLAELLKTIETRKTLELECLAGGYAGAAAGSRETRRKHKRHKRKAESPNAGEDSRAAQEDVSETASELRSSASTDTGEGKWSVVLYVYTTHSYLCTPFGQLTTWKLYVCLITYCNYWCVSQISV